MPQITLRFKDIKIRDYSCEEGHVLTIGRKHSNDIVIDNLAVSGNHARIESVGKSFVLRDLNSTNGTFVNDEKVSMHNLRHDDVILIGNHKLVFDDSERIKAKSNIRDDYEVDKTRILDTTAYHDPSKKSVNTPIQQSPSRDSQGNKESTPSFFAKLMKIIFG